MADLITNVIERTKRYEGFREETYIDTVGKATIGYGTNLDNPYISFSVQDLLFKCVRYHVNNGGSIGNNWKGLKITKDQAEEVLKIDLNERWRELFVQFSFLTGLPGVAQEVLLDMCYNLGLNRLGKFKKFLAALQAGDFRLAAVEMLDSRWAHQVKRRATEQANEIRELGVVV